MFNRPKFIVFGDGIYNTADINLVVIGEVRQGDKVSWTISVYLKDRDTAQTQVVRPYTDKQVLLEDFNNLAKHLKATIV